jgi:2-oxoisovalerate dehydrogenase E1 component
MRMTELSFAEAQEAASNLTLDSIVLSISPEALRRALRIRAVENSLLDLFQAGKIGGTIHTCIGQELSPALIAEHLNSDDFFTSNHRCHGHFIARTEDWKGLVLEILGSRDGVCRGVGSSQHLAAKGFLSNGPQGSLLPVGTGIANSFRGKKENPIVFSFLGEGTLGEGIFYESLNMSMVTASPQLFICENNFYSQSTQQISAVAGTILARPQGFGMKTFSCNIWNPEELTKVITESISYVRKKQLPAFLLIQCYRLMAHSKGDDNREQKEVDFFRDSDPISRLVNNSKDYNDLYQEFVREVRDFISNTGIIQPLSLQEYATDKLPRQSFAEKELHSNEKIRSLESLRLGIHDAISRGALIVGEDIADPYGGAFKATKGISTDFPLSVISTPISEAALVGFAIGTALVGRNVFAEIMFGDFITYAFDQIVSNASKFLHVYNLNQGLPLIIRIPNGGHRGYGPTHSQSLEKHLIGLDNLLVIANTSLLDTRNIIPEIFNLKCPTILIENKIGYSRILYQNPDKLRILQENYPLGNIRINTSGDSADITIISYGEIARDVVDSLVKIEESVHRKVQLLCLLQLHPIRLDGILSKNLGKLVIVAEEGSKEFGIGGEIAALLAENQKSPKIFKRIASEPYPIASNMELEDRLLPNITKITALIQEEVLHGRI